MFGAAEIPGSLVVCLVPGQALRILHSPAQAGRGARSGGSGFEPQDQCVMRGQFTKDRDLENRQPHSTVGKP